MTLVTGNALDPKKFFKAGSPIAQGSSFDLTIGFIFDPQGKQVEEPFTLKPGHMVQVVSAEIFDLKDRFTGHVTYKTTLTKKGIWALTVGIVDPGWDGPITTTLLNFSKAEYSIAKGDPFLRVSIFEHEPVPKEKLRQASPLNIYLTEVQKTAASGFPPTFLDTDDIATAAGAAVLDRIRKEALVWVASIAFIFTILQLGVAAAPKALESWLVRKDLDASLAKIEALQQRLLKVEQANSSPALITPAIPQSSTPAAIPSPAPRSPAPEQRNQE